MYAIIRTGGKQLRVKKGDVIHTELLGITEENAECTFSEILFVNDGKKMHMGAPIVTGFSVKGKRLGPSRGKKIDSMKYQRRKNERHHIGHRQHYDRVEITDIVKA